MQLNLTFEHFAAFALMAYIASHLAVGAQLARLIGFIGLWQLLTPVRPMFEDVPLMIAAWSATELLYRAATAILCKRG